MPEHSHPQFCGLPPGTGSEEGARFLVLPVPYERTTTWGKGTAGGPDAIIEASRNMELYDEELGFEPSTSGILTDPPLVPPEGSPGEAVEAIRCAVGRRLSPGRTIVSLGGEHGLSCGAVFAHLDLHPDMGILQIDAHADLRDAYDGSRFSHACVMRRIAERSRNLCQVGIRSMSAEEAAFLETRASWPVVYAREAVRSDGWMDRSIESLPEKVYLTLDVDGLDPSLVPATGTPEPGGLSWHGTLRFLRRLCERRVIVGFDVVELAPQPSMRAADFLVARLIYKIMGYSIQSERR